MADEHEHEQDTPPKQIPGKPFKKGQQPPVGKPFTKGDARINRGGRPKNFDMFRHLAQQMGNEVLTSADGTISITRVQAILRDWMTSKDPRKQLAFIEYAFGKVPASVELKLDETSIDSAIKRELEKLAANREAGDAGTAEGDELDPGGTNVEAATGAAE